MSRLGMFVLLSVLYESNEVHVPCSVVCPFMKSNEAAQEHEKALAGEGAFYPRVPRCVARQLQGPAGFSQDEFVCMSEWCRHVGYPSPPRSMGPAEVTRGCQIDEILGLFSCVMNP